MCVNVNVINESISRRTGSVSMPTQGITRPNVPSVHGNTKGTSFEAEWEKSVEKQLVILWNEHLS